MNKVLSAKYSVRNISANLILVANALIWYFYAFSTLGDIVRRANLTYFQISSIWIANFIGTAIFALVGAAMTSKMRTRVPFLLAWMGVGSVLSFIPILLNTLVEANILGIAFCFGAVFGFGMPAAMGYFANSTIPENRARLGGATFFAIGLGMFLLGIASSTEIETNLVILTIWRLGGLLAFILVKPVESPFEKTRNLPYTEILNQKAFLLYFIAWIMFCMVNQTSAPIIMNFFGENFVNSSVIIESVLSGAFAIIGGLFSDRIGRKRVAIFGFAMLGVGYGALGILPLGVNWYVYSVTDGIAWGIFYVLFFMTIWGDLAHEGPSEKFYALGELPYLFSNFLRFMLGSFFAEAVLMYAIFSLASFFLFLAVLPLTFAPETLPERRIKELELRGYIDKAKKARAPKYA